MGLKGKIFKFMSDFLKDGSYYKLYTQAKSTSACGLPKGFFLLIFFFSDENTKDTKITSSSETILHGLKKYSNYSMQVLAFTNGGDGVRSSPIHCHTEQDGNFFSN